MSEGIQMSVNASEPTFFATTQTLGNGDRHYAFCLKFFDEISLPENETRPCESKAGANQSDKKVDSPLRKKRRVRAVVPPTNTEWRQTATAPSSSRSRTSTAADLPSSVASPIRPLGPSNLDEQLRSLHRQSSEVLSAPEESPRQESGSDTETLGDAVLRPAPRKRRLERHENQWGFAADTDLPGPDMARRSSTSGTTTPEEEYKLGALLKRSASLTLTDDLRNGLGLEEPGESLEQVRESGGSLYMTKALIILSKFQHYRFFKEYLTQIYLYSRTRSEGTGWVIPLERFLTNLVGEIIAPPPGNDLMLEIHGPCAPMYLRTPSHGDFPLLEISMRPLLLCLDRKNIVTVFAALTIERKLVFTSNNPSLLYHVTHAFLSLLYPFEWQTAFVPIVPPNLLELTQAPTPTVLGIMSGSMSEVEVLSDVSSILMLLRVLWC